MDHLLNLGYLGLFIGSFLASTIIPMSADALLVGMLIAKGEMWLSLALATTGNWLGGITSYLLGYLGKEEWLERWLKVKRGDIEKQRSIINRFGALLALFAWLPIVGDLFAIALGFYRVSPKLSILYMLIGRFLRFSVWIYLFYNYKHLLNL